MIKDEAVGALGQDLTVTAGNIGGAKPDPTAAPPPQVPSNPSMGFEMMEEDHNQDLWLTGDQENLIDVNDPSIFYTDFPPLPDFPCMSSSSSTSSAPAPPQPLAPTSSSSTASSSSPSASWAMMDDEAARMNSFYNQNVPEPGLKVDPARVLSSNAGSMEVPLLPENELDCFDVVENFCYMDLFDSNEIWDPSSVFQTDFMEENVDTGVENNNVNMNGQQGNPGPDNLVENDDNDGFSFIHKDSELSLIFLEWLKHNKDCISAADMRTIRLKRSTIEAASKRLGNTREGKKQLLKLILDWVEQHQLQNKKISKESAPVPQIQTNYVGYQEVPIQNLDPNANPNPNRNFSYMNAVQPDPNACYPGTPWMANPGQQPDAAAMAVPVPVAQPQTPAAAFSVPMAAYGSVDPYSNQILAPPMNQVVNGIPYPNPGEYQMMDAQQWAQPTFHMPPPPPQYSTYPENGNVMPHQQGYYGHPYQVFDSNGERLVRLGSSATKEARKKRMARQRRLYSHHRRNNNSNQPQGSVDDSQVALDGGEEGDAPNSPGSWAYWSPEGPSPPPSAGADSSQPQGSERAARQTSSIDRRLQQSWKTEKNLKFLLQKVLKQSDVGNLGRIVLPKKEAESHLPELESRDGMPISMEDIGTSRVWNMRYRFWPNNKSRMYLLENTGDFVRVNGLQEGDFIVIYSDTKCGKYMIRGVKVRQPGGKVESKKMARRNSRSLSFAGNSSLLAPIKQAVK